jgi:hypothetical protein
VRPVAFRVFQGLLGAVKRGVSATNVAILVIAISLANGSLRFPQVAFQAAGRILSFVYAQFSPQ